MPVHTVPADALEATVLAIEASGAEDILIVTARGNDMVIVTRRRYSPRFETRKASGV